MPDDEDDLFTTLHVRENSAPVVYEDDEEYEGVSILEEEIWLAIRTIKDPEHDLLLHQLRVVSPRLIRVDDEAMVVSIEFVPTVPHCSLSTVIGLCIRVRVLSDVIVDKNWKISIQISKGTHLQADAINKQLSDKERIAAALENPDVVQLVNRCTGYKT